MGKMNLFQFDDPSHKFRTISGLITKVQQGNVIDSNNKVAYFAFFVSFLFTCLLSNERERGE